MKTRFLFALLLLLGVFGLAACQQVTTVSTTDVIPAESVAAPTNLSISGKVLSWTAVAGVTQYKVYVNGVETATVNTTSYDFTSLTGDSLLFTVVAVGPTGYEDSVPSASVAYVANPAIVIAAINAVADGEDMTLPEGVAAELVRKGITGPIFQNDIDAVQTFQTAMETADGDMSMMNDALTAFVADVENYEAYLSAFLLIAPDMIDEQIASEEENRAYYEDMLDMYPGDEYYLSRIDEINRQIETLTNMQTAIEENRDQMLVTVMAVVDYLLAFHEQITVTLIEQIEAIADDPDATAAEIVLVKNEITTLLLDNLPSGEDLTLVFELLAVLEDAMNGDVTSMTADLANEYAAEVRIMLEIEIRFLASLDATFIDDMMALDNGDYTETRANAERAILFIMAFSTFEDANQVLIDSLDNVFTEAQEQAAFEAMVDSYAELMIAQGASEADAAIVENILLDLTYQLATAGGAVFDDMAEKAFDHLVATNCALIRLIAESGSYVEDFDYYSYEYVYRNDYQGVTYPNETDYRYAQNLSTAATLDAVMALMNATVGTMTEAQLASVLDMVLAMVPEDELATQLETTATVLDNLVALLNTTLDAQDQNVLGLLQSFIAYANTGDLFGHYGMLVTEIHNHNVTEFGADYLANYDYDGEYERYATVIFIAHHLDAWITPTQETQIDAVVGAAFDFMANADFLTLSGMTLQQVTDLETALVGAIDDVIAQAGTVGAYDADTLTTEQMDAINDFMMIIPNAFGGGTPA